MRIGISPMSLGKGLKGRPKSFFLLRAPSIPTFYEPTYTNGDYPFRSGCVCNFRKMINVTKNYQVYTHL